MRCATRAKEIAVLFPGLLDKPYVRADYLRSRLDGGRACSRGMRITVALVVNLVANGMSAEEIIREYPDLEREDVRQSLQYASALANEEIRFFKSPAT